MTKQEELFIESIKNKITKFSIQTTLKEVLEEGKRISNYRFGGENILIETKYNTGEKEIVSPGIEWFLCSKSPYYFVENYGVISVPNIGIIPFDLYYFQQEILKEIDNYKKTVYLKTRQAGISVLMSHYCLWRCLFRSSENIDVVSIKKDKAQDFVSKMKTTLESLPTFLQVRILTENKSRIEFENKSQITSEPATENAGRSDTLSLLVMDEAAFYRSDNLANCIVASAIPALTRTGGSLLIISTPNGMSGAGQFYYEQVQEMKLSTSKDERLIEIDWFEVPDIEGVKPAKGYNKVLEKYIRMDYYNKPEIRREMRNLFHPIFQNWRENEWLKSQHRTLGSAKFEQEIGHNFVIMENAVISKDYQDKIKLNLKEPLLMDRLGTIEIKGLWIWKLPQPSKRYICGCLPAGEKVVTNSGLKNIEDITLNDILLNKDGNEINIINKQITHNFNDFIYEIKTASNYRKTKFTGEHPILSSINTKLKRNKKRYWTFNFTFNKAEDLKEGDWLIYPNVYKNSILKDEDILNKWPKNKTRIDFKINNPLLNEDFWWYIGIWLAEGWTSSNNTIYTAHNLKTEQNYKEKIIKMAQSFGRSVSTRERAESNSLEVCFSSKELAIFINDNFGKYAKNKKLPEWVKKLPENLKIKLVEGYLNGDGSIFKSNSGYILAFVSISNILLEDIQDILYSLGILSSLQLLRKAGTVIISKNKKESITQETYQLIIGNIDGLKLLDKMKINYDKNKISKRRRSIREAHFSNDLNYIFFRIKDIKKSMFKGTVYNFETEDHTYLCKNIITHNCDISKGSGKDTSSMEIIDVDTYEQVAEYKGFISTAEYSKVIKKIARFYNEAYVVIESNGIGEAVFNGVYSDSVEPYYNVFKQKKTRNNIEVMTGWNTDVKTRQLITNNFIDWIVVDELFEKLKIYSSRLYEEITTWVIRDGRPDHANGCVSKDTLIETIVGTKRIDEIEVGDLVLTHNNNFKKVLKTYKFKDENKKMLKIKAYGKMPIEITSNHKFYLNNKTSNEFIEFDNIYNFNDYLSNGIFSLIEKNIDNIDLLKYNKDEDIEYDNEFIYYSRNPQSKKMSKKYVRFIELNKAFLFLIGHILADGSINDNYCSITMSSQESKIYNNFYKEELDKLGIISKILKNDSFKGNFERLGISGKPLINFLKLIKVSENKKTLEELRFLNNKKQMYILLGYFFGDGCFRTQNNKKSLKSVSISHNLNNFMASILFRNNIEFNMNKLKTRRYKKETKDQYSLTINGEEVLKIFENIDILYKDLFINYKNNFKKIVELKNKTIKTNKIGKFINGYLTSKFQYVKKIDWNDYYYDIEVEDDHSYIANGYAVHNSHDDSIMAFSLALYNRNRAERTGDSFLVDENGKLVELGRNEQLKSIEDKGFGIITSDSDESDIIEKKYGMDRDTYTWLIG